MKASLTDEQLVARLSTLRRGAYPRLRNIVEMTGNPNTVFTTIAMIKLCGRVHCEPYETLKHCFYEVKKPNHFYQTPRLYRFHRLMRAVIQVILEEHEAKQAELTK